MVGIRTFTFSNSKLLIRIMFFSCYYKFVQLKSSQFKTPKIVGFFWEKFRIVKQIGILNNKIVNREQIKQTKHYIVVGFVVLVVFCLFGYYGCVHGMDMNELTINILGIICI